MGATKPGVAFQTFGCKVNQYDAHALRRRVEALGLAVVPPGGDWSILVVSTCAVTGRAQTRGRRYVRRAAKRGGVVVVTGCAPRMPDHGFGTAGEGVVIAPGMDEALEAVAAAAGQALPAAPSEPGLVRFYGHSRAFLKVADGCPGGCTYCIIPRLRGPLKSRPPDEIVAEAGRLVTSGHNEIVLTAIHLGLYGTDLVPSLRLWDLTARVLKEGRLRRLRLSSLEVSELTPPLVAAVAGHPRMANHLHIPLQSGDDGVLHRMGRSYTADQYRQALANLRRAAPHVSVSTDVIAGFPGESEQSFEATLSFVEEAEFSRLHAFPFSPRPGTEAADFDGTVPDSVKTRRIARLVEAGRRSARAFRRRFVGRTLEVLVERVRETPDGLELRGLSSEYIPVRFPGPPSRIGDVVAVTIADEDPDGLLGDMHTENR